HIPAAACPATPHQTKIPQQGGLFYSSRITRRFTSPSGVVNISYISTAKPSTLKTCFTSAFLASSKEIHCSPFISRSPPVKDNCRVPSNRPKESSSSRRTPLEL